MNRVPLSPANKAPLAPEYPWPDTKNGRSQSALFLAVDVDAESAWTAKDPANYERLVTMSYGGYEARVGVPKMLELFREMEVKATFFITGWAVEAHPAMAESILKDGHEIAHQDPARIPRKRAALWRRLDCYRPRNRRAFFCMRSRESYVQIANIPLSAHLCPVTPNQPVVHHPQ